MILMDKQQILTISENEFLQWHTLLEAMSEEQITTPYAPEKPYNRSVKEVVAHLWAWQQRSNARLKAAWYNREILFPKWPEGLDPELEENTDAVNSWIYTKTRNRTWRVVHREWRKGFLQLMSYATAIPERDLMDPERYPWLNGYSLADIVLFSMEHHREHREPLTAWLRQQGTGSENAKSGL